MPNYANSKVYKITGGGMTYIGSTTLGLSQRFAHHKNNYKQFKEGRGSCCSAFQLLDCDDCHITLLEDVPCERKEILLMKERGYIETFDCVNKIRPIVSKKEMLKNCKEYRETNKEHISQQRKEYRNKNREKNIESCKEWYEINRQIVLEQKKIYYEANKELISLKGKTYFTCECGSICRIGEKNRHFKSQKHQSFLSSPTNPEPRPIISQYRI